MHHSITPEGQSCHQTPRVVHRLPRLRVHLLRSITTTTTTTTIIIIIIIMTSTVPVVVGSPVGGEHESARPQEQRFGRARIPPLGSWPRKHVVRHHAIQKQQRLISGAANPVDPRHVGLDAEGRGLDGLRHVTARRGHFDGARRLPTLGGMLGPRRPSYIQPFKSGVRIRIRILIRIRYLGGGRMRRRRRS